VSQRRSGLHPFSQRVAFIVGGGLLAVCAAALIWVRSRVPPPAEIDASVQIWFAPVDAARPLTTGSKIPNNTALVVRARNQLPRPVHALAFALDATGRVHWFVPPRVTDGSAAMPSDGVETALPSADRRLPLGAARLVTLSAFEPLKAADVEAQVADWWQAHGDLARGTPLGIGAAERSIWVEFVEQ
jgi:hypothetical protein